MKTFDPFWLIFSIFSGTFWGSVIGLIVMGRTDIFSGIVAGVMFGWIAYSLVLVIGGLACIAKVADEYRMH